MQRAVVQSKAEEANRFIKTLPHKLLKTIIDGDMYTRENVKLINDCIAADSNSPYWDLDYYYIREDLRNPTNAKMRRRIFRHFGIKDK